MQQNPNVRLVKLGLLFRSLLGTSKKKKKKKKKEQQFQQNLSIAK